MLKSKIKSSKLTHNPLFTKILNWEGDKYAIEETLNNLLSQFQEESDQQIIRDKIKTLDSEDLDYLSAFQASFKKHIISAVSSKSISEDFILWLNNAYKYIEEKVEKYINDETRHIKIKDPKGRWLEAVFCYNFIMTFNYFGIEIIKFCPICGKCFAHKGKYARYCGEECKEKGIKK